MRNFFKGAVGTRKKLFGLVAGPIFFSMILLAITPQLMPAKAEAVAAVAVLMAIWWITEAIPIPATALLPIALFPLLGVMDTPAITRNYAHHLIYLFLGGFWIAVAMEKWDLHRRIALHILRLVGSRTDRIVLGFMLATAFLSMWLSNTATAMMMLPIGMAVISKTTDQPDSQFAKSLMLGIAYAASIGGVATLIGTPPNAVLAGVLETLFNQRIPFWKWMIFGLPLALLMLLWCWFYLTKLAFRSKSREILEGGEVVEDELRSLGTISYPERSVLFVFLAVAGLWLFKGLIPVNALRELPDSSIAIIGALMLFIIPVNLRRGEFLLDWQSAVKVPWDVIILFGGGFALAHGFEHSGLTEWIGMQLDFLQSMHWILIALGVALITIFLTEVTSNTATASMLLPIIASLAVGAGVHPFGPMVAAALAASFAFMLPVATPPNAIIYASRQVTIPEMAKAGFWLNLTGILIIIAFVVILLPSLWEFQPSVLPEEFDVIPGKKIEP